MDPDAKYDMAGEDGTVGAKKSWDGEVVDQGSMTITGLEPEKSIKFDLAFGDFMVSKVALDLTPAEGGTEVKWSLHGDVPFMGRAMMMLRGMEGKVGKDFETGLTNLKAMCEARQAELDKATAERKVEVMSGDRPAADYVGIKSSDKLPWSEMSKFYMDNTPKVYEALGKAHAKPTGPLCGLYYDWNEKDMTTSMMVCVPVAAGTKVAGLVADVVPAGKAYWTVLKGGYFGMYGAHDALGVRIAADNMDHAGAVLEEYVVGQNTEPDSTKWVTNIIYTVKPKS